MFNSKVPSKNIINHVYCSHCSSQYVLLKYKTELLNFCPIFIYCKFSNISPGLYLNFAFSNFNIFSILILFTSKTYQMVYVSTFLQEQNRKSQKIYALVPFFKGVGLIFESPYIRKFTVYTISISALSGQCAFFLERFVRTKRGIPVLLNFHKCHSSFMKTKVFLILHVWQNFYVP